MGKAIVIKGLEVTNPLTQVTIYQNPEEAVLANYLATNQSINETETAALKDLVAGLIDYNLWGKFKYFYPLLGSSISDMILDVVDTSHEDIFSNAGTTGLSVSNRVLIANNRQQSETTIGDRAKLLDANKLGFICAGKSDPQDAAGGQGFRFNHGSSKYTGVDIVSLSGYKMPIYYNGTEIKDASAPYTAQDRVIFGNIVNGLGSLYDKSTELANGSVTIPSDNHPHTAYGVLWNYRSNNYSYNFFAITEGMNTNDWLVAYPLIGKFLQDVGKS